jgi:hypothetical protein
VESRTTTVTKRSVDVDNVEGFPIGSVIAPPEEHIAAPRLWRCPYARRSRRHQPVQVP